MSDDFIKNMYANLKKYAEAKREDPQHYALCKLFHMTYPEPNPVQIRASGGYGVMRELYDDVPLELKHTFDGIPHLWVVATESGDYAGWVAVNIKEEE